MHLAILGSSESWYAQDLARAAGGRHRVSLVGFRSLASHVEDGVVQVSADGVNLSEADAVLVRSMPPGSLEQVVFRMDALGRLEASGTAVVNPPRAIELAVDKYLSTARLAAAGLRVPRTRACQTVDEAMAAFDELGGDVVLKPLFGSEGRGIARLNDVDLAWRALRMLSDLGSVLYLQEFIQHEGHDLRVLVVGPRTWAIRRTSDGDWRTNLSRGARAEAVTLPGELLQTARRAAAAVGASLAGVDLLPGRDGSVYVLEVNAVPGWKGLAAATVCDVSRAVLEHVETLAARNGK